MSNTGQQQAVTSRAAIGQEKVIKTVTFAITGDEETDFVAGILAVFTSPDFSSNSFQHLANNNRIAERVCTYLARRFKEQADFLIMRAEAEEHIRQQAQQSYPVQPGSILPNPMDPSIWPYPSVGSGTAAAPDQFPYTGMNSSQIMDKLRAQSALGVLNAAPGAPQGKTLAEIFMEEEKIKWGSTKCPENPLGPVNPMDPKNWPV